MTNESNPKSCCSAKCGSACAYTAAIIGSFLIIFWLTQSMKRFTRPEPLGVKRAEERATARRELDAANKEAVRTYGWVDQSKGIVRLPVERAMELTIQLGKDPAAARANLLSRINEATKPVSFE